MTTDVQRMTTADLETNLAIEAVGLEKSFGKTKALAGLDLEVPTGTILAVLGPNGAGKTTAVRVLTTLLRPDRGSAKVAGYDVVTQAPQVRRCIGLAGQSASLDESLTGAANLVMIGQLCRAPRQKAKEKAAELLERFDLADAADRGVKTYSGGMRRRLDLAAAGAAARVVHGDAARDEFADLVLQHAGPREIDIGAFVHRLLKHALEIGGEKADLDGPAAILRG